MERCQGIKESSYECESDLGEDSEQEAGILDSIEVKIYSFKSARCTVVRDVPFLRTLFRRIAL